MVLTKQDLQEWNSNPVTQQIFKEIEASVINLRLESVIRDTVDQTAMQASYNDGMKDGVNLMKDHYFSMMEESE